MAAYSSYGRMFFMNETYISQLVNYLSKKDQEVDFNEIIEYYLKNKTKHLLEMNKRQLSRFLISEFNYTVRKDYKSSELVKIRIYAGDICYIDYGKAYINEAGFQHFGLVIGTCNSKALVIPMSSNYNMYSQSYCPDTYLNGKPHLFRLPEIKGLHKKSVLFLNDTKFINTARVIEVKGCISVNSKLYRDIIERLKMII